MKKLKVKIQGETYEVSEKAIRNYSSWSGKEGQYIYISHAEAGSLVRQFVKKNFPQYVCKVSSQSFSGGNSLDVYLSTKIGGSIPPHNYHKINEFAHQFEYGKFDGMHDIYEHYENSGVTSDNGNELQAGVKYVTVNNRPRFGTVEAILNEVINEGREFGEVTKFYTDSSSKPAVGRAKQILDKLNSVK